MPADDGFGGTGTSGPGGPRSNVYFPSDEGGGGSPISNIASQYMPADDGSGGIGPRLSGFMPTDDSTGTGDPRSAGQNVAAKLNLSAFSAYAATGR